MNLDDVKIRCYWSILGCRGEREYCVLDVCVLSDSCVDILSRDVMVL